MSAPQDSDYTDLPPAHRTVLDECIAEAWRNVEQNDALTERDVAADIAQRLVDVYDVVTYPREVI
jgi:TRAP-type C4-dicarboxylate transport system substrate-binding protein